MEYKKIINKLNKRINCAIRYLDRQEGRKNWLPLINLKELNLDDASKCVCGQIFVSYWNKFNETGDKNSIKYGFSLSDGEEEYYDLLTHLWWIKLSELKDK